MPTITLFTQMPTTNHVSEHVLQCSSWYPVHSALNVGLKLLQCVGGLNTQYPWDAPIKRSLRGLSPGIVEATVSLKWGVQEAQIPSKPWVVWFFEHPVFHLTGVVKPQNFRYMGIYEILKERDHFEDVGRDESLMLK
jgi:hypothetical protein